MTSSKSNLALLREIVETPDKDLPAEALSWLSRLLVLRSCGHLEQVVQKCAQGYVEGKAGGPVRSFSLTWLAKSRNPSARALRELAERFDPAWAQDLDNVLDENEQSLRRLLGNLVDFRNLIAHGQNQGVTREKALELGDAAESISDWWITTMNPHNS
ncbi:hypothetical protein ABIB26_003632 [Arthrobacter sp. UYEF20]